MQELDMQELATIFRLFNRTLQRKEHPQISEVKPCAEDTGSFDFPVLPPPRRFERKNAKDSTAENKLTEQRAVDQSHDQLSMDLVPATDYTSAVHSSITSIQQSDFSLKRTRSSDQNQMVDSCHSCTRRQTRRQRLSPNASDFEK
jgi:hypothetical protein